MAIKARYDPAEDRMLMSVRMENGERLYWVTRRLWLSLYRQFAELDETGGDAAEVPPPKPARAAPIPAEESRDASRLERVQFSRTAEGIKLLFSAGGSADNVGIGVRTTAVHRFRRLFEMQAERAGWDPAAALDRLSAGKMAAATLKKASR
jgi:hypothetical protein